jgi:uncharacterized protein (TIGR03437 family)
VSRTFKHRLFTLAFLLGGCFSAFAQGGGKPTDPGKPGDPGKPSDPGKPGDPGKPDSAGNQSNLHARITWLTSKADLATSLLDPENAELTAEVQFKSNGDIENVEVWLTPSLKGVTADPDKFDLIKKDEVYTITLTLEEKPTHTLGGTLHLRDGATSNRTYAPPLPINVKFKGTTDGATEETEQTPATVSGVAGSADYRTGSVSPGQAMSLFGDGIGPEQPQSAKLDDKGRVAKYLGDTQAFFNGLPAPILAATRNQVNVIVPGGVSADQAVEIVVTHKGKVSQTITLPVEPTAPALFTIGGTGTGQSAALNQDSSVNSPLNRARRGAVVTLFGSGFGEWKDAIADGAIVGSELPALKAPVSVTIGGVPAKVLYAGGAPGLVSGVVQINAEVPLALIPGDRVAVSVTAGGKSSPGAVTLAIQ